MATEALEHWHYVVGMARRFSRGGLDPEDLAQDVFERWIRAAPRLPAGINARAWMTVVLRRLAIDQLRRHRVCADLAAALRQLPAPAPDREPPPWWLELDSADVARVLGELPAPLALVFRRFALDGRSYDEIARELRIAKATVGVRLLRARRRLRLLLAPRGSPGRR